MVTQEYLNNISYKVIGAAIEVHRHLGPGLLESVYQTCLADELRSRGLKVTTQVKKSIFCTRAKIWATIWCLIYW